MGTVTVSSKYQIVIPQAVRQALKLKPGQKLALIRSGQTVRLVPVVPIEQMRGRYPGLTDEGLRDKQDREI